MEQDPRELITSLKKFAAELSISIPDSSIPLFCSYLSQLKQWNKAINLTAIQNDQEIVVKHFVDSLAGIQVIDINDETDILDIGAGAGFPAFPLKFIHSHLSVELVEPSGKKGSFLRYVIGSLGLQKVTVATMKLEDYVESRSCRRLFDYIVVRAFKVGHLGNRLGDLLKPAGKVVLYRSTKVERDFKLTGLALIKEVEYELPAKYGHRVLSVFVK